MNTLLNHLRYVVKNFLCKDYLKFYVKKQGDYKYTKNKKLNNQ